MLEITLKKAQPVETAVPLDLGEAITKIEALATAYNKLVGSYNQLILHLMEGGK